MKNTLWKVASACESAIKGRTCEVACDQRNGKDGRVRDAVSQFRNHQPGPATNRFYRQSRSFRKYRRGSPAAYMGWKINCRLPESGPTVFPRGDLSPFIGASPLPLRINTRPLVTGKLRLFVRGNGAQTKQIMHPDGSRIDATVKIDAGGVNAPIRASFDRKVTGDCFLTGIY